MAANTESGGSRWLPSLTDAFFLIVVFMLFLSSPEGWERLVWDGDTGLHTRTGDFILDQGAVPKTDPFSFTMPGERWFAFQWLSGVVFALLNRWIGLKGIVLLSGLTIAFCCLILLRHMLLRGANGLIAMLAVLVGTNAMSIHFHARPHVFTLAFLALAHYVLALDQRKPSPWLWTLVPLTVLWANMHSGFPVLLMTLALAAAGHAFDAILGRSPWADVRRYAIVLACAAAASLLNPNGLELYGHISRFLNNPWILEHVNEYQSPVFRSEAMYYYLAILFAGLLTVRSLLDRAQWTPALWILVFGAASLVSSRHVPIFVVVALPFIAVEATTLLNALARSQGAKSTAAVIKDMADRTTARLGPVSLWTAVAAIAVGLFSSTFPKDLSARYFPLAMVERHAAELAAGRPFTTDQWGDYLLWKNYPRQKVYIDGRSDFFQQKVGNGYVQVSAGARGWRETLAGHGVDLALLPADLPLVETLRDDPTWQLIDQDKQAVLFRKR